MLVLTRKQGEQIRIGKDVTITVVRTKGKTVRLGIEAPAHVNVLRGELLVDSPGEQQLDPPAPDAAGGAAVVATESAATPPAAGNSASVVGPRTRQQHPGANHGWSAGDTQPARRPYREQAALESDRSMAASPGPLRAIMDEQSRAAAE